MADRHRAAVGVQALVGDLEAVELVAAARAGRRAPGRRTPRGPPRRRSAPGSGRRAASAFGIANAGAIPMTCGSSAWVADATTRASGSTPSSSAAVAAGEHDRAGAVVQRRGVAGRHLGRVRLRRERRELLGGGVAADALVVLERPRRLLAGGRDLDRVDLLRPGAPSRAPRPRAGGSAARTRRSPRASARSGRRRSAPSASCRCRRRARAASGWAGRRRRPTSCRASTPARAA